MLVSFMISDLSFKSLLLQIINKKYMVKKFILLTILGIAGFVKSQNVNIPDANFKAYLIGNISINTNGDNEIQISEANSFTGSIVVANINIADLTGIGSFVNLVGLHCPSNNLTRLDISNNTKLMALFCGGNKLTTLDISKNLALRTLHCEENEITFLNVHTNNNLTTVYCLKNQLNQLNLKNGQNSKITNLDASENPSLLCILVDNVANANSYTGWKKDSTANYNIDCGYLSLANITTKEIYVFPNPVKDILNFSEEVSNIRILDISGNIVKQISTSEISVNLSKLAKGTYILSATAKTGETINKKFIKE